MKNILLISNIYPTQNPNYGGTHVCHFFTREWIKMGYNVRVIHFDSLFPKPYYWIGKLFNSYIQAKTGCVVNVDTPNKPQEYKIDDVPVLFVPLKKTIPHKPFTKYIIDKGYKVVCNYLKKNNFTPDAVVAHFPLPQLQFLYMLKQEFPLIKTTMVIHSNGYNIKSIYKDNYQKYMDSVDVWGFRSVAFKNQFEAIYGKQKNEFLCYSGIPEKYIQPIEKDFGNGIKNFSFLGSLYKLKRVEDTIKALNIAYSNNEDFHFDIIGSGAEEDNLKNLVSDLKLDNKITFHGQQKRDIAQNMISESDCFIMVSAHEAFGLVYVEAMAKGCITIATKGQGIDGVIIDGVNGFLCEPNNPEALAKVINRIKSLSTEELNSISKKAVKTASELTDRKVAETYIKKALFEE
ncbi:MAG: glycosyltransferase family 4 protein [Bacteroidales bacterium]|nr:glycosyltransferase family 4 protein [Bacteroidales bacterium]